MMAYLSTRGSDSFSLDEAVINGLAPDGGLYIPEELPWVKWQDFLQYQSLPEFAYFLLAPFFKGSAIRFTKDFCQQVFDFPMPLHSLTDNQFILELFHGPTLSFKDFGARFFAACLSELKDTESFTVMVATSGDTGSAVAAALHDQADIRTVVLFPDKQITARQQAQISTWGNQVKAVAVKGRFDQCQQLVKAAFADKTLNQKYHLTTANSINIARLLPQMLFYAYSSVTLAGKKKEKINFIVPGGNLGNVTACYWAKKMGFPIEDILISTNANDVLKHYWETGQYEPKESTPTLANAMDVGNPSNLERLNALYPDFNAFQSEVNVDVASDEQIKQAIKDCYQQWGYIICPHTATAYHRLQSVDQNKIWVATATADPAKFEEVIEPLLGLTVPLPERLKQMLSRKEQISRIEPKLAALIKVFKKSET